MLHTYYIFTFHNFIFFWAIHWGFKSQFYATMHLTNLNFQFFMLLFNQLLRF